MFVIILIVMILLLVIFSRRPGRSERRERIYLVYVEEAETPPLLNAVKAATQRLCLCLVTYTNSKFVANFTPMSHSFPVIRVHCCCTIVIIRSYLSPPEAASGRNQNRMLIYTHGTNSSRLRMDQWINEHVRGGIRRLQLYRIEVDCFISYSGVCTCNTTRNFSKSRAQCNSVLLLLSYLVFIFVVVRKSRCHIYYAAADRAYQYVRPGIIFIILQQTEEPINTIMMCLVRNTEYLLVSSKTGVVWVATYFIWRLIGNIRIPGKYVPEVVTYASWCIYHAPGTWCYLTQRQCSVSSNCTVAFTR